MIELILLPIYLNDDLGRRENRVGGMEGMQVLLQCKIGDRVQFVEVRTRNHEEVAQHPVAEPVRRQVGQTVENIKCARPGLLDHIQDFAQKPLEALLRVQVVNLRAAVLGQQRRVAGKPEIDQLAPEAFGLAAKRTDHREVVRYAVHFPHHIVARPEPLQHAIQAWHAGAHHRRFCLHCI